MKPMFMILCFAATLAQSRAAAGGTGSLPTFGAPMESTSASPLLAATIAHRAKYFAGRVTSNGNLYHAVSERELTGVGRAAPSVVRGVEQPLKRVRVVYSLVEVDQPTRLTIPSGQPALIGAVELVRRTQTQPPRRTGDRLIRVSSNTPAPPESITRIGVLRVAVSNPLRVEVVSVVNAPGGLTIQGVPRPAGGTPHPAETSR